MHQFRCRRHYSLGCYSCLTALCLFLLPGLGLGGELAAPDQADWSSKRVASFARFSSRHADADHEAVLRVPDRHIEARIYPDSQRSALEGGLSRLTSTSNLAAGGNTAIAGHRDSFFRRLEGIKPGEAVEIEKGGRTLRYIVTDVDIVDALDVSPLEDTGEEKLTLITCHPFYYEGYAPDRFIVTATLSESVPVRDNIE